MKIGMVGLGRMGANMVRRLVRGGHGAVVFNRTFDSAQALAAEGGDVTPAATLEDLVAALPAPRTVWLMLPAGATTDEVVGRLATLLSPGDILVDGGNSLYKDDVRRAASLAPAGIRYLDVGTSGGVWGLERGYSLMIGGDKEAVDHLAPVFRTLAPGRGDGVPVTPGREHRATTADEGWLHCGPVGAGHFVKMVHNGIEYGMMQAFGEGFDILRGAGAADRPRDRRYDFDLAEIAEVWRHGSVVGSWLLDLTAQALVEDPQLDGYEGVVQDSGEGRWTIEAAIEEAVPADVLSAALFARFRSRQSHTFAEKVLSAMRMKFGGHREPDAGGKGA